MPHFSDHISALISHLRYRLQDVIVSNEKFDNNLYLYWWLQQNQLNVNLTEKCIRESVKWRTGPNYFFPGENCVRTSVSQEPLPVPAPAPAPGQHINRQLTRQKSRSLMLNKDFPSKDYTLPAPGVPAPPPAPADIPPPVPVPVVYVIGGNNNISQLPTMPRVAFGNSTPNIQKDGPNNNVNVLKFNSHPYIDTEAGTGTSSAGCCSIRFNFRGLIQDIKRRYPLYLTDITDGINIQCIAAIIFISFAQISGSVAFGGLMGSKTENNIGISETLIASGLGGIIFSLFAGQPLLIVGTTGPLLLFDESLYNFCKINQVDFLGLRTWIGIWLSVIALIFVGLNGSLLVRFFTRFTQEVFAALISLLFIAESILNLKQIYVSNPLLKNYGADSAPTGDSASTNRNSPQPNTALLSSILMFGTFGVAWFFRSLRNGTYFTKSIRRILGNFAVPIAIGSMVLVDYLTAETETKKLDVPDGFQLQPTAARPWFVNPVAMATVFVHSWGPAAAIAVVPAVLLFILVFMEVSISELIVSKSENKLVKGSGFHIDVLLTCLLNTGGSLLGLPWMALAIVRCVAHVSALTVRSVVSINQDGSVDGNGTGQLAPQKAKIVGVKEQRISGFCVSLLTCLSILCAPVLGVIPMAVLFGVFLFMGVSSMGGIQIFKRISLMFKQVQNHPQVPYVRYVRPFKMHMFTLIQIFWLVVLWSVKYTKAAMLFPFILLVLIPFRFYGLPFLFNAEELLALDSTGQ